MTTVMWTRIGRHGRVLRLPGTTLGLTVPTPRRHPRGGLRRIGRWRMRPLTEADLSALAEHGVEVVAQVRP